MKTNSLRPPHAAVFTAFFVALLCCGAAGAASTAAPAAATASAAPRSVQQLYRAEMAYCASGQSVQGRKVCEQEARAAHAQNLRGALADQAPQYRQNARLRCQALAPGARGVCLQQVDGEGRPGELQVVPGSETPLVAPTPLPRP